MRYRLPLSRFGFLLVLVLPANGLSAQTFPSLNGAALKGVASVDAKFWILAPLSIPSDDVERMESNGQEAFELALRRDGLVVEVAAPNYLVCTIMPARMTTQGYVYSFEVAYYAFDFTEPVHHLLWRAFGLVTGPPSVFTAEELAADCVDPFVNEWLKQNPGSEY